MPACVFVVLAVVSCQSDVRPADAVRRDSAGVTIVESSEPAWRSTGGWSLADTPSVSIGVRNGTEQYQFTHIMSASVLSDSIIAVANFTNPPEIRAFTLQGEHRWTAGGEGAGPGEFQGISWIDYLPGDTLRVFDFWQARMSYFDIEGDLLTVQPLSEVAGQFMTSFVLSPGLDGGRLVARNNALIPRDASGRGRSLTPVLTIDRSGALIDTIAVIPDAEYYVSGDGERSIIAFGPRAGILAAGGWIYLHTGERYRIDVYAPDGRLHRSYRRHDEPRQVRSEDMEAFIEARLALARNEDEREDMEREYRETPHADVMPAYDRPMLLDPSGNLWVRQYTAPLDSLAEWAVTSPDGAFLGLVSVPLALTLLQIGDSFVLGVWRDDLGIESLRVHELRKAR